MRLFLRAGISASLLCFISWLFFQATETWQNLDLNAGVARLAVAALDGPTVLALICTWGALLLAVLLTLALRVLGPSDSASCKATSISPVGPCGLVRRRRWSAQGSSVAFPGLTASGQPGCCLRVSNTPVAIHVPLSTVCVLAMPSQQVRALLAWQLPPRALLASWCGGLSLAEALGVGGWLGLNLWWLLLGLHSGIQPGDPWDARLNA